MSLIPTIYRSTDPGAPPPISNTAGSLVNVLDAILVNGYGSGGSAKAPLGWSIAFSGLNKRVYRNSRADSLGNFLRVDDTYGNHSRIDAYESMSSVDAGTGRFDTAPSAWGKISSGSGAWLAVGNQNSLYISHNAYNQQYLSFFAGDFNRLGANDAWPFVYSLTSSSTAYVFNSGLLIPSDRNFRAARAASGAPGAVEIYHRNSVFFGANRYGNVGLPFPLPTTSGMLLSRSLVQEGSSSSAGIPRGFMPGLWVPEHDLVGAYAHGSIHTGFADLPSGTELLALTNNRSTANGMALSFLDVTNPW